MSLIRDLYSEIIMEHYRNPHNLGELPDADFSERGHNESCGDDIVLFAKLNDGKIEEITFEGKGCAISQSSASMMTDILKGKTIAEAKAIIDEFKQMITGEKPFPDDEVFDEVSALKGVVKLPIRVKCATLCWNTMRMGLRKYEDEGTKE